MGAGFVMTPMNFFLGAYRELGAPVMSYVISSILDFLCPPLSHDFFVALRQLLNQTEGMCNFDTLGEQKSQKLYQKIEEIKHAMSSSEITLKGVVLKLKIPDAVSSDFSFDDKVQEEVVTELFGNDSP